MIFWDCGRQTQQHYSTWQLQPFCNIKLKVTRHSLFELNENTFDVYTSSSLHYICTTFEKCTRRLSPYFLNFALDWFLLCAWGLSCYLVLLDLLGIGVCSISRGSSMPSHVGSISSIVAICRSRYPVMHRRPSCCSSSSTMALISSYPLSRVGHNEQHIFKNL